MGKQNKIPQLRFPEFKNDWDSKELSEIATKIGDGIHGTPKYDEEGEYFFINGNNLIDGNIVINETTKRVDANEFRQHGRDISDRTILLSINGTIGNLATYKGEAVVLGKSAAYINIDDAYHLHFAYYSLLTNRIQSFFNAELTGSTIKNLSLKTIRATKIFFSSFPEQQKIASFFTAIDQKISQLKRKKTLLEQYKKGVMQKIFSQGIRFKDDNGQEFPKWEKKKLKDVAEIKYGKDQKGIACENGQYPIFGTGGVMGRTNEFLSDKPSVLIGRKGTIDKPLFIDTPFWTVDTLFYTNLLSNVNAKWLYYNLTKVNWYKYNEASGVPSLSTSTINKIPIDLPSLGEQTRIANFLSAIDDKINHTEKQIEKAEVWKKGLMQQMFV